jgi:hypothetical protein
MVEYKLSYRHKIAKMPAKRIDKNQENRIHFPQASPNKIDSPERMGNGRFQRSGSVHFDKPLNSLPNRCILYELWFGGIKGKNKGGKQNPDHMNKNVSLITAF